MFKLPEDIINKIDQDFDICNGQEIKDLLSELYANMYKDGPIIQAIRGIIFLANKDVNKLKDLCIPYMREPRGIIAEAEEKAGNPGHWFNIPFDEMKDFNGGLPKIEDERSADDNLPF